VERKVELSSRTSSADDGLTHRTRRSESCSTARGLTEDLLGVGLRGAVSQCGWPSIKAPVAFAARLAERLRVLRIFCGTMVWIIVGATVGGTGAARYPGSAKRYPRRALWFNRPHGALIAAARPFHIDRGYFLNVNRLTFG
jgi:hypothetical protein